MLKKISQIKDQYKTEIKSFQEYKIVSNLGSSTNAPASLSELKESTARFQEYLKANEDLLTKSNKHKEKQLNKEKIDDISNITGMFFLSLPIINNHSKFPGKVFDQLISREDFSVIESHLTSSNSEENVKQGPMFFNKTKEVSASFQEREEGGENFSPRSLPTDNSKWPFFLKFQLGENLILFVNLNQIKNPTASFDSWLQEIDGLKILEVDLNKLNQLIVQEAKLIKEGGLAELKITLKPEFLGQLKLTISVIDGQVSINFLANEKTKEIIEAHLAELKTAIQKEGLAVGDLQVSIGKGEKNFDWKKKEFQSNNKNSSRPLNIWEVNFQEKKDVHNQLLKNYLTTTRVYWLV